MRPPPAHGLAPAVAEHRDSPRDALGTAVLVTTLLLAFNVLIDRDDGLVPGPVVVFSCLLCGAVLGLVVLRSVTAAGPGWLARQHVRGQSWIRTDQLAQVRAGIGVGDVNLRLRDRDGRRMFITWSSLAASPKVLARLQKDVRTSAEAGADLDKRSAAMLLSRGR